MDIFFLLKVVSLFSLANVLPVYGLILLYKHKRIPEPFATLSIPMVVIISNRITAYLNFGRDVDKVVNYLTVFAVIILIFLSEKYNWLHLKPDDKKDKTEQSS